MKVIEHEGDRVKIEVDRVEFAYLCKIMPQLEATLDGQDAGSLATAIDWHIEDTIESTATFEGLRG